MTVNPLIQNKKKPLLRGYFHQEAFFVAIGACGMLIAKAATSISLVASLVYSFGLLTLLGTSALYHRQNWEPKMRSIMKRLDHSAIFILIAGTFTPVCLLALSPEQGYHLLLVVWSFAFVGIIQSLFWVHAPKWLTAPFYVLVGWLALPYLKELQASLGLNTLLILGVGGVVYTLGAVCYAFKFPNIKPSVFGYHELFHVITIVGAVLHFTVVYQLIQ